MPERSPRSLGGELLAMGAQVAAAVAIPLLLAAIVGSTLDRSAGTTPWALLVSILVGLVVASLGVFAILRRYLIEHPVETPTEAARAAARRWQRELEEEQRRREAQMEPQRGASRDEER